MTHKRTQREFEQDEVLLERRAKRARLDDTVHDEDHDQQHEMNDNDPTLATVDSNTSKRRAGGSGSGGARQEEEETHYYAEQQEDDENMQHYEMENQFAALVTMASFLPAKEAGLGFALVSKRYRAAFFASVKNRDDNFEWFAQSCILQRGRACVSLAKDIQVDIFEDGGFVVERVLREPLSQSMIPFLEYLFLKYRVDRVNLRYPLSRVVLAILFKLEPTFLSKTFDHVPEGLLCAVSPDTARNLCLNSMDAIGAEMKQLAWSSLVSMNQMVNVIKANCDSVPIPFTTEVVKGSEFAWSSIGTEMRRASVMPYVLPKQSEAREHYGLEECTEQEQEERAKTMREYCTISRITMQIRKHETKCGSLEFFEDPQWGCVLNEDIITVLKQFYADLIKGHGLDSFAVSLVLDRVDPKTICSAQALVSNKLRKEALANVSHWFSTIGEPISLYCTEEASHETNTGLPLPNTATSLHDSRLAPKICSESDAQFCLIRNFCKDPKMDTCILALLSYLVLTKDLRPDMLHKGWWYMGGSPCIMIKAIVRLIEHIQATGATLLPQVVCSIIAEKCDFDSCDYVRNKLSVRKDQVVVRGTLIDPADVRTLYNLIWVYEYRIAYFDALLTDTAIRSKVMKQDYGDALPDLMRIASKTYALCIVKPPYYGEMERLQEGDLRFVIANCTRVTRGMEALRAFATWIDESIKQMTHSFIDAGQQSVLSSQSTDDWKDISDRWFTLKRIKSIISAEVGANLTSIVNVGVPNRR